MMPTAVRSFETEAIRSRVPGTIGFAPSACPYPRAYTSESFRMMLREMPFSDHSVMKLSTTASISGMRDRSLVSRSLSPLSCPKERQGRRRNSMKTRRFT